MSAVGACASASNRVELRNFLRARCEQNGSSRDCRIINLSTRTVFVESFVPPVTGSVVSLYFRLPNGYQVSANGVVSDHRFREGFSVDFIDLPQVDCDQINNLQ